MGDSPSPPETRKAFVLAGLPGCGKSTAADIIEAELQHHDEAATATEVSDFVRTHCEARGWSGDDNELGRVAADIKDEEGQGFFVRRMAEQWHDADKHVIISGLRSPEEAAAVRDVYGEDQTVVIAIWTLPDLRFERKYGETPSEEHPKWEEFHERNERETHEWGCLDYFADMSVSDYIVQNNGDLEQLEGKLNALVREEVGDGSLMANLMQETPFPEGLDREHVAQYL